MKIWRASLLLLVVFCLVWQSEGWWRRRRRRRCPSPSPNLAAPTYRKCIGQARSKVQSFPMYGPLSSGLKSSGPVVNGDTSCYGHPQSSNSAGSAPFFHGRTRLFRRRRDVDTVFQWSLSHRVLLFRGEVFEWGVGANKGWWEGLRCPSDCAVKWKKSPAGYSTCTRAQAELFSRQYKSCYGSYRFVFNNCHYFVNRLMKYLDSGCTRMP